MHFSFYHTFLIIAKDREPKQSTVAPCGVGHYDSGYTEKKESTYHIKELVSSPFCCTTMEKKYCTYKRKKKDKRLNSRLFIFAFNGD